MKTSSIYYIKLLWMLRFTEAFVRNSLVKSANQFRLLNSARPLEMITETAQILPADKASLQKCGVRLREEGNLVAFPTETVYGLGCNALNEEAIKKVFLAKERPLTDPLIVHVLQLEDAKRLWKCTDNNNDNNNNTLERQVIEVLTEKCWPGPLTLVAEASSIVPPIVTAQTGFVGARSPSHPIARALIEAAEVPIAAPSANKFGHVSPTSAKHVYSDLHMEDVWIVDDTESTCHVGVESTVAKVFVDDTNTVIVSVLRHGAISETDILKILSQAEEGSLPMERIKVQVNIRTTKDDVANVAPGQTIKHYAPNVPSFMVSSSIDTNNLTDKDFSVIKKAVVIDFGQKLKFLEDKCLAYRELSFEGRSEECAPQLFDALRWSETIEGAEIVYFPEITVDDTTALADSLVLAVKDRLTRAASGVTITKFQELQVRDSI